jgi:hypothetical protein
MNLGGASVHHAGKKSYFLLAIMARRAVVTSFEKQATLTILFRR